MYPHHMAFGKGSVGKTTSVYFDDASVWEAVKKASELEGKSVSVFIREVMGKAAAAILEQCPTCGAKRPKATKGTSRAAA